MTPLDLSPFGLALAFGAGLVSFASPCVLPLVPGYLAWVAGTDLAGAQARRGRTFRLGLFFVLGFGAVFIALGASATGLSGLLRRWSAEAAVAGGALVAAMGLVQMGLLRLPVPLLRDLRLRPALEGGTPGQAALVGVAFGFGWTPCIGPVLAAVLAAAATSATAAGGVALLAAYAAGLGVPFLLAALYLPELLGRARRAARLGLWLQRGAGAAMVAMGIAMATGDLTRFGAWMLQTFPALALIG
ncbi:cytochrome C biogenesis protein CcdA [Caldovatus sediminis]|uniref:Cytochrome C biogenesis protein CcdA n=1 Tax=Caldovatus sediminis TaxID=2041189 RepID=A0A8J2ZG09_9PROT|nr:cytochrome c biogenesis protein CcdA [Caldovatus sediminis]GGG52435.1 cytochrome C biogenesis protein CcdA [Caldovatus sediminis]